MFKYTLDNKRYHTFNYFLRNKFNSKVFKIPIDAHASCPNKLTGGCIYCKDNSKANITDNSLSLYEQYINEVKILNQKWPNAKHIIYFQTGTNTYMPLEEFKKNIEPFLGVPEIVGISIATRSDSLTDDYIEYFKELNKHTFLTVELGLQSSKNETLKLINRGHDKENFAKAVKKLKENNIFVVAHIINGLPFENKEDMLETINFLNQIKIDGVKIHMLHVLKDTSLEKLYNNTNFHILTKEEYIDIVIDQLELLDEKIVIERITGDPIIEDLITPTWLTKKFILLNDIDKEMVKRNTYQGKKNN
ncbi:MAG: TIGR01212 family radical SAM protein [Firmicutes bacterium]|nr:TIGR01212 family radical SAM protein [Bacillota bacterium]